MRAADQDVARAVDWLRTPVAIRERAHAMLALAERGALAHFDYDPNQIAPAARHVAQVIEAAYPDLDIPIHSRWRHFAAGGIDRWGALAAELGHGDVDERARIRIDLAVTSVLLDAGAGATWLYREPGTDQVHARSEGLAVASFHVFAKGLLSSDPDTPLRADAKALTGITADQLATAFQAGPDNPLTGLAGRVSLLNRLGAGVHRDPELFGGGMPRIGNLYDWLAASANAGQLSATQVLAAMLRGFAPAWPDHTKLNGIALGDVWRHPGIRAEDETDQLVPFHKLAQWLTYSLIEPLEEAGLTVTDQDALTGLAEYRNGGLLVDLGVLRPKYAGVTEQAHAVDDEVVVEWRALTVALLDRLATDVRAVMGVDDATLPLAKLLEAGTWPAGRQLAYDRRPGGAPPIQIASDGTVF